MAGSSPRPLEYEPVDPPTAQAAAALPAGAMGATAARGFAWAVVQMVSVKLVSFGGQIVLTRFLLDKADISLAVLTASVAEFANVLQRAGLREVLIRRHAHFNRWSTAAFWMALTLGLLATAAMAAAAPLVAWAWSDPAIIGLILTAAVASPFASVSTVASAKVEATFRFRAMTFLSIGEVVAATGCALILAKAGAGAYSLVIPVPLVAIMRCAAVYAIARPRIELRLRLRRWRFLYVEGGLILGAYLAWVVISQGDYVILKTIVRSDDVVASYWQAFTLSIQTIAIFSMSLLNVLLPVLSHLGQEPKRQVIAFLRAVRVLAVLTMPLCVLQAVLAEPGVRFVFGEKWMSSVPLLQILSFGMAVRVAAIPAHSMLKAQGRLRTYLVWMVGYAAAFCALVTMATWWGGARGTALGVAATIAVAESAVIYICIRPAGFGWREVFGVFAAPVAASLLAGLAAWPFNYLPATLPLRDLIVILAALATAGPVYLLAASLLSPAEAGEIRQLARRVSGALRPRRQAAPPR